MATKQEIQEAVKQFQRELNAVSKDKKVAELLGNLAAPDADYFPKRIVALYEDAKRRNGGNSLSIYGEVSDVLDAFEDGDDDAAERADNLCNRLRLEYGAEA